MSYHTHSIFISYDHQNQPCVKDAILIRLQPSQQACPDAHLTLDWYDLWRKGSHTLWFTPKGIHVETVHQAQGHRPWTRKIIPRKDRPGRERL